MNTQHPLYYHCWQNPNYERYGLLRQRDNSFYIIDSDPILLKNVQLVLAKYEFLNIVNIDHYFTFLDKTQKTVDSLQIVELTKQHNNHVSHAAIFKNNANRIKDVQKNINNDNCFMYGLTLSSSRAIPADVTHFRLTDNIIQHLEKNTVFDSEIQEKAFLIRHLLYTLKGVHKYLTQFVSLQETIGDLGLNVYKDFFSICNPKDNTIPQLVEQELKTNAIRLNSLTAFCNTIFKEINLIDLQQSTKDILLQVETVVSNSQYLDQKTIEICVDYQRTYDMNRVAVIVTNEILRIVKIL